MKKIKFTLISLFVALFHVTGYASGLVPNRCSIFDYHSTAYPIQEVWFYFDGAVGVTENSFATVYSDSQPVATGILSAKNYVLSTSTVGTVIINFDPPIVLPKGKTYSLVVPADVISSEGNPAVTNDELSVEFEVPENLGEAWPSIKEGSVVYDKEYSFEFNFAIQTASVENGEILLYRKDVPIKKDPVLARYDSFGGYARMKFPGYGVYFESGVEYTVRLPEGSVCSFSRPDITNEEATVSFFGGCTGHFDPIVYTGCSLSGRQPSDVLGEVQFYYNKSVALCVTPSVQLYNVTDGVVEKEVVPTLVKEEDRCVMTVDFGNTPLVQGKIYSIIIPEATVVSMDKYIRVNQCNTVPVVNNSGVSAIEDTIHDINVENGTVTIDGTSAGAPVTLLSLDGKVLYNAKSNGGTVSIPVETTGIYLLSVNGKTHKIAVRN